MPATTLPPLAALYHVIVPLPVANKLLTLGIMELQKLWLAFPVGAGVVVTVNVGWSVRSAVEQPLAEVAVTLYVVVTVGTLACRMVRLRLLPLPVAVTAGLNDAPPVVFSS